MGRHVESAIGRDAAQALRAFFRYGEATQQCRPAIVVSIAGPRRFDHETLPAPPPWTEVRMIIRGHDTERPADIRRHAALLLFATYGFRVGEAAPLTLDDVDWEHNPSRVRRSEWQNLDVYPLSNETGCALLRYITTIRARCQWRHVFLTLLARYAPLWCGGLWSLASQRAPRDCRPQARR